MTSVAQALSVRGEVSSLDDLVIEGHVQGPVWCDGRAVTIASTGTVDGYMFARDITVLGAVSGTLVASEVVDIRPQASVTGRIVAQRLILTEGGSFNGTMEPQHLEAALRVARHRRQEAATPGVRPIPEALAAPGAAEHHA